MKYIELFAGIGGFRKGLEQASDKYVCVWANEWDKYAGQIYKKHFKEIDQRDITKVSTSEIPDHDLLVGGFPCQAFSIAGKRRGFDDTRGTLFFEIARILQDKQPKYFILENVKGLLSHNNGNTFRTIISTLTELGYDLQWQVVNSKNFGVPQNRERVFIVGHLRGQPRPEIFPIRESNAVSNEKSNECATESEIAQTLTATYSKGGKGSQIQQIIGGSQGSRVYKTNGISCSLTSSAGGFGSKTGLYATLTPNRVNKRQNGRRFKEDGEPSFTLTSQDVHGVFDGYKIRRLTPVECERLQGFPDGWTEGVSDTQRYKCLGNAVTVNVVEYIARKLIQNEL